MRAETGAGQDADWAAAYAEISADLGDLAARAPLLLAGLGTCIDAILPLADLARLEARGAPPQFVEMLARLIARAAEGVGGEIRVDWKAGPGWLRERLPLRLALGGTGPQAAATLAMLGAPSLVALEDRSRYMLDRLPDGIFLASGGRLCRVEEIAAKGKPRPEIFIFEFTEGQPAGPIIPPRSSRVITRFSDPGLEHDAEFAALSARLAGEAGTGLISGFSAVHRRRIDSEVAAVRGMTAAWRAAGLAVVHLELATFTDAEVMRRVIEAVPGHITSLGMSESEFVTLCADHGVGAADMPSAMAGMAAKLELDRLCVHADRWAAAVTTGDPERERRALLCGCLLSARRAAAGAPAPAGGVPEGAEFAALPFARACRLGRHSFTAVAAPYLRAPASTLGLGDSFTAGCLLVLGQR